MLCMFGRFSYRRLQNEWNINQRKVIIPAFPFPNDVVKFLSAAFQPLGKGLKQAFFSTDEFTIDIHLQYLT